MTRHGSPRGESVTRPLPRAVLEAAEAAAELSELGPSAGILLRMGTGRQVLLVEEASAQSVEEFFFHFTLPPVSLPPPPLSLSLSLYLSLSVSASVPLSLSRSSPDRKSAAPHLPALRSSSAPRSRRLTPRD